MMMKKEKIKLPKESIFFLVNSGLSKYNYFGNGCIFAKKDGVGM